MLRPMTTQQAVTKAIREMILQGDLAPGERIDQDKTAMMLGVSRMPVRESLRVLQAEGLVTIYPHQGAVVSELSPDEIEEIFSIRAVLEALAARTAIKRLTQEHLEIMAKSLVRMKKATDHDEWLENNELFHSTLYETSGRSRLLRLITSLRHTVRPYIRLYICFEEHARTANSQHLAILEACRNGDADTLVKAIENHLQSTCQYVVTRMRNPELVDCADVD